jgi:hypothetical protein
MPLTPEQRAELEAFGPEYVRDKMNLSAGAGPGAAVPGFKSSSAGNLTRADVEEWLVEKHREAARIEHRTLRWAKIAGWAAILAVLIGAATLWFTVWPKH